MATTEREAGRLDVGREGRPSFEIRRATVDDVDQVAALEKRSFSNPWQPQTFRSLIRQGRAHLLVAVDPAGEVLGYAVAWGVHEEGELANVAVKEEYQGMGMGSALLDRVMVEMAAAGVESLFLEVRMSNQRAQDLYASRGFHQVAVRKGYYQNPREDALVLLKKLGDGGVGEENLRGEKLQAGRLQEEKTPEGGERDRGGPGGEG